MMPVPSRRFVGALAALAVGSVVLLIFPGSWPPLVAANLIVFLAAGIDLAITPRPAHLRAVRMAPERMSVLRQQQIAVRVENTSGVRLFVRVRDAAPAALGGSDVERGGPVAARGEARWEYAI